MDSLLQNSYRRDPVTRVLGKDIAGLVWRQIFQMKMSNVNKEYHEFLVPDHLKRGFLNAGVQFFQQDDRRFSFNYRSFDLSPVMYYVHNIKGKLWRANAGDQEKSILIMRQRLQFEN